MNRVRVLSQQVHFATAEACACGPLPAAVAAADGAYVETQHLPAPQPNGPAAAKADVKAGLNVVPATRGSGQVASAVLDKGYAIVDELVDAATIDAINQEMKDAGFLFAGEKDSFAGYDTFRNAAAVLGMSKTAQQLATHPVILNAVRELLLPYCKRIKLGTCSRICKFPKRTIDGKAAPPQVLHRDDQMYAGSDWPYAPGFRPEFLVGVMWALTDFTKENGATNIVPGSHRWPTDPSGRRPAPGGGGYAGDETRGGSLPDDMPVVSAEMKCGSAAIWLGSTLHGAGQHDGEERSGVRDGLFFIYNLGWLNNEHNWHFTIPLDVQRGMSEELQDLLGHTDDGTRTDHPWITGPIYTLPYQGDAHALDDISGGNKVKKSSDNSSEKT